MATTVQAAAADSEACQPSLEQRGDLDEQAASVLLNLKHDCEDQYCDLALEGLCDQAMDDHAASVLLGLERDCEALGDGSRTPRRSCSDLELPQVDIESLSCWALEFDFGLLRDVSPEGEHNFAYDDLCAFALKELEEHCQRYIPKKALHTGGMAMTMQAAAADFEAGQPNLEHCYDLALEGLCDQAMDEQAASVLLDLERDCAAMDDGSRTPRRSCSDLELPQVDIEPLSRWAPEFDIGLFRDGSPEGEHDRAYYDLCASALKKLEVYRQRLLGELESAGHQLFCRGLRMRLTETIDKLFAEYMLWAL